MAAQSIWPGIMPLYATGKVEGQLTEQDVYALASHYLTQPQIRGG